MERQALLSWSIVALHGLDVNTFFENSRKWRICMCYMKKDTRSAQYLCGFPDLEFEMPHKYWDWAGWNLGHHSVVEYDQTGRRNPRTWGRNLRRISRPESTENRREKGTETNFRRVVTEMWQRFLYWMFSRKHGSVCDYTLKRRWIIWEFLTA